MTTEESNRFRSVYNDSFTPHPEFESEQFFNTQENNEMNVFNEFQSSSPSLENYQFEEEVGNELLENNESEFQLFADEIRDSEFEGTTFEMMQQLESNFEGYAHSHGNMGELESISLQPNFENVVNGYFESSIAHLVPKIDAELESFSNYIQTNVPEGTEYDRFEQVIDEYQTFQSEALVESFVSKFKRIGKAFLKKAKAKVLQAAKTVSKAAKFVMNKGILIAFKKFVNFIRSKVREILKRFVRYAIGRLDRRARPYVMRAAKRIGLAEYEAEITESDAGMTLESEFDLLTENELNDPFVSNELELETESMAGDSEEESEAEFDLLMENENQVAEITNEFDRELYNFGEYELNNMIQSTEASNPYSTEASNPYSTEASNPYSTEASNPYSTEASNPYSTEASNPYSTEASNPYSTEASNPYSTEASNPYSTEASNPYSTEASNPYSTEASNPYSTEASNPYSTEASNPYSTEASNPYSTEASNPYSTEASNPYSTEASNPYSTEASNPYSTEASNPYSTEASNPYSTEASNPYSTEASNPYSTEASNPYSTEASNPYSTEASNPYSTEASNPYSTEASNPYSTEASNPYSTEASSPYSTEASNPYSTEFYHENEDEGESEGENKALMMNMAFERFVTNIKNNPSSFNVEFEQFAPALITAARVAFRVKPALRSKVVNLIAQGLNKLLGKYIPQNIGDLAYKPLAGILLKLMGLEAFGYNQQLEARVFAEAMANTTLESIINVTNLPSSVLEGDHFTLESEINSIVRQAVLNNFPERVLPDRTSSIQHINPIQFITKGKYQMLNRPIRITLTPSQISGIKLGTTLTLNNFLTQYYNWDGKSSVTLDVNVFKCLTNMARPFRILRNYFGRGRPIRLSVIQLRQLLKLTKRMSKLLNISRFWSPTFPMYFIIKRLTMNKINGNIMMESISPRAPKRSVKGNEAKARLDRLGNFNLSFYLNQETIRKIKSFGRSNILAGLRTMLVKMVSSGRLWLTNLLSRLRIPRLLARGISKMMSKFAVSYINRYSTVILKRFNSVLNTSRGLTITLRIQLPPNIVKNIRRLNPLKLLSMFRSLRNATFSILVSRGNNV